MAALRGHGRAGELTLATRRETRGSWRRSAATWMIAVALSGTACAPRSRAPDFPAPTPPAPPTPAPVIEPGPPTRPAEGTVRGDAGALWYRVTGAGPDTVLVPLGSWLEDALAPLAARHVLVYYDPRHRGRSHALADTTAGTFDGDVADLESVRQAIGIGRAAVVAVDYYAAVAAAWAARHPGNVTRLVLVSPIEPDDSLARGWNPPDRLARLDTAAARRLVKDRAAGRDTTDPAAYCAAFWRVNLRVFVHDTTRLRGALPGRCDLPNEAPIRVAESARLALSSLGSGVDAGARAAGLAAPTLVVHGRQDLVANPEGARAWARRVPGARVLWLSNVGHLPWLESRDELNDAIVDFLAGRWPPRAALP